MSNGAAARPALNFPQTSTFSFIVPRSVVAHSTPLTGLPSVVVRTTL